MTFYYTGKERYLTDSECIELVKMRYSKVTGSIVIRICASIPFFSFLYLVDYTPKESMKLIGILLLSILGLMLPAALSKVFSYTLSFFLKIIIRSSIPFFYLIDLIIKTKLMNEAKESLLESLEKEDNIELLICFSFILIAGFLLWFTLFELTEPDYKTIAITMISIIYGTGISKYSSSLLEIAGFDLILLKKNKDENK